jgi:Obg family GTPase CgtA-like protein
VLRPGRPRFTISREGRGFRVTGREVERWVLEADLEDEDTVRRLQRQLVREGVERQLAAAGARRGDEVLIADKAFEFLPDPRPDSRPGSSKER